MIAALAYKKVWASKPFYIGWTPVFLLALTGVILELTQGHIGPPGAAGIAQCFFSLAMAAIAWAMFRFLCISPHISS